MTPADILDHAKRCGIMLATAESCTGGMIAASLSDIAGSSAAFDRGFVTYSNAAKQDMLGVPAPMLDQHGAVSAEVAKAMAEGALHASKASLAVAVTGIAGPGGGTEEKPVGLVYIATARRGGETIVMENLFAETLGANPARADVRDATVQKALIMLGDQLIGWDVP